MATSLAYTNSFDGTDAGQFIPEVWSDDVIASYKKNLVLAGLVAVLNHKGKKGDTIHVPQQRAVPEYFFQIDQSANDV